MEAVQLWAGVTFSARGGHTEALLNDAAGAGLQLAAIVPRPGGFDGRCAAWRYRRLAKLARQRRVRLQVQRRRGLFSGCGLCSGVPGCGWGWPSFFPCCCGAGAWSGLCSTRT